MTTILQAIQLLRQPGDVFEIRIPEADNGRGFVQPYFGYFDNFEKAAAEASKFDRVGVPAVYITLNPVNPALLARAANRIVAHKRSSAQTTDADITRRVWFGIDVDPNRPKGVSASNDEHQLARDMAVGTAQWLREHNWPTPIAADSGNGFHLIYRVNLPNDTDSRDLLHACLLAIGTQFPSSCGVNIDPVVYNASRIWKLYGTTARKGDPLPDRPHRKTCIIQVPDEIVTVPIESLQAIATKIPKSVPSSASVPVQGTTTNTVRTDDAAERCRRYFEKVPGPVSGQGLNAAIFKACCLAAVDFKLDAATAAQIVCEWASACGNMEWVQKNITRMVAKAMKSGKHQLGCKADAVLPSSASERASEKSPSRDSHGIGDLRATYNMLRTTDLGNAERLLEQAGSDLRFTREWKWLVWDGARWALDDGLARQKYMDTVPQAIYREIKDAADIDDDKAAKKLIGWAKQSENACRQTSALSVAQHDPRVYVETEIFDLQDWRLNVANGTIDLRTGLLSPHRREDFSTKMSPIIYDKHAKKPERWLGFLDRIFAFDGDLIEFIQKSVGYSLTGSIREQCFFLCYGTGRNGKTVFTETVSRLLGDYALETPTDTLMARKQENANSNDVARLVGARFVTANETEEGARLAESKIKALTGDEKITARFLHKEFFQFKPQFKLWLRTNHEPDIRGTDEGIWRRLRKIPFTTYITDDECDPDLQEKLSDELSGILSWAVEGCLKYQSEGLDAPVAVETANKEYREQQDIIGHFLGESCVIGNTLKCSNSELRQAYEKWCERSGQRPWSAKRLTSALKEKGFERIKTAAAERGWAGFRTITLAEEAGNDFHAEDREKQGYLV